MREDVWYTCLVIAIGSFVISSCATEKVQPTLNIILINSDDLSAYSVGAYGQKVIKTPRLDQMAKEGVMFTKGYSPASVCMPSRVSLMLGKHLGHLRHRSNHVDCRILPEERAFPELLQEHGYQTAMFGKASDAQFGPNGPVDGTPTDNGFDLFVGTMNALHAHPFYLDGKTAPSLNHPDHLWKDSLGVIAKYEIGSHRYTQNEYVDLTIDYIEQNQNEPFFLYLASQIPHWEIVVPRKGEPDYKERDKGLLEQYLHEDGTSRFKETPYAGAFPFERPVTQPKATYAAMISRLDRDVGRILDKLSELGLSENTLVIFTSDNGIAGIPNGGDPFQLRGALSGGKAHLLEGGLRVPYIFWGGGIQQNKKIEEPIVGYDLASTILDAADIEENFETDGVSFMPTLQGQSAPKRDYLYWENYLANSRQAVLIDGRYKAIKFERPDLSYYIGLYDLEADISESKNLADSIAYQNILKKAKAIFQKEHEPAPGYVLVDQAIFQKAEILKGLERQANKGQYSIDLINDKSDFSQPIALNGIIKIEGWAVDSQQKKGADELWLVINDAAFRVYFPQGHRPDVAKAFGIPNYNKSGFETRINTQQLVKGKSELALIVVDRKNKKYYPKGQTIAVEIK